MHPPALRFAQVIKRYAGTPVLRGVDLAVSAGELFGLVGVNGAGKSSLIRCLFDFISLDAGSIDIFGRNHLAPAARSPLVFLPENFAPPYYFKGIEFVRYVLKLHRVAYQHDRVQLMFEALDLAPEALTRLVRDYSKGMTQKLGLAACLLAGREALVLDEPMSGLDPKARALVKVQLQMLRARGATAFFSTHALADVAELCDRMAILHGGRIVFVGSPAACLAEYDAATLEQAFLSATH